MMAARPRIRDRRDWPKGLNETKPGYFVWFNPISKTSMAIGRKTLAEAKMQALEANLWATQQMGKARLVDRLQGEGKTVRQWLDEWLKALTIADNTRRTYKTACKAISELIGDHALMRLSVKDTAEALDKIATNRGDRTSQVCRTVMKTAFNKAMTKGLMTANPAMVTESPEVVVTRQRFTWETFSKVWAKLQDGPVWLKNAVALGLLTGQRREDIAALKFTDVVDGHLRVTPIKNQGRVKLEIPLDLRLNVLGVSLREQIAICRRTGVVSQYMVHQTEPTGNSPPGRHIFRDTISKRFTEHVQEALEGEDLPTFHELRSLCKRLYIAQGSVDTKALLGHTTDQTAALYQDARGAEFQKVKIG